MSLQGFYPIRDVSLETALKQINDMLERLFNKVQPERHRILATVPVLTDLTEGEIVLYDDTTTRRIYARINGAIYSSTLS